MLKRFGFTFAALAALATGPALAADPLDPLVTNCEGPAGDPAPGTPEFALRDLRNIYCTEQRHVDSQQHPVNPSFWMQNYGADAYRAPNRHNGTRFRHQALTIGGAAADVFRPCSSTPGECPSLAPGLQRFDPPYPIVIVMHGLASDKNHLWWASQPLAERGYLVVAVNGTGDTLPNTVLNWVNGAGQTMFPGELDAKRVGITGHSLGAENSTRTQGDPRVSAIIAWDPCNNPAGCTNSPGSRLHDKGANAKTPALFFAADYSGFPGYAQPRTSVPGTLRVAGFTTLRTNGVDSMLITPRATTHLDWAGSFTFGNRYAELISSYFGLAWFDRYLKGKLLVDAGGNVVTSDGRNEAEERAYRQAIAQEAFERLSATVIDDSADRHNISQGFWDPVMAAMNADPLYGGNVPYSIAGQPVADRLSFYHRSVCYLSVPDYRAGSGGVGQPVMARADSTDEGDMRKTGCPVVFQAVDTDGDGVDDSVDSCPDTAAGESVNANGCSTSQLDSDGDGVNDDVDACPNEAAPGSSDGCPVPPDTTPNAFSFTSVSGVNPNTTVSSNVVSISGIDAPAPISVTTGEYRINGGVYTSAPGQISNGQTVQVRHTSAATANTVTETVLTIGGVVGKFRSTTAAGGGTDTDPDAFGFVTQTGVAQNSPITSDTITPANYDSATVKAGAGTAYSIGCTGSFITTQGTITQGQSICVQHTSASSGNTLRKTSLQIGKTVGYFSTRTAP